MLHKGNNIILPLQSSAYAAPNKGITLVSIDRAKSKT